MWKMNRKKKHNNNSDIENICRQHNCYKCCYRHCVYAFKFHATVFRSSIFQLRGIFSVADGSVLDVTRRTPYRNTTDSEVHSRTGRSIFPPSWPLPPPETTTSFRVAVATRRKATTPGRCCCTCSLFVHAIIDKLIRRIGLSADARDRWMF